MPRMANNEYVGPIWEVFASWCKPLKWAAGRVIPPDMINPTGAVKIMTDKGIEFQIDYDTFRNSQDPRLVVAKNALRRDMPELDASLAMRSNAPPPEILREMAQTATWRSGTSSLMEGTGILTSTGRIVPKPEPRTAADAAEEAGDADETPAATSKPAARPAPAVTAARAPIGGNNAMVRSAVLQDSFPSVAY